MIGLRYPRWSRANILLFLGTFFALAATGYFSFSLIFTLFLSEDFGYSDVEAGTLYGAWGALVTIYGLVTGYLIDNWGVARSLQVGFLLTLVSRIVIFLTSSRTVLVLMVCGALPFGGCLGIPVLTVGIRRYTNETNRGFAFGLFYVVSFVFLGMSYVGKEDCRISLLRDNLLISSSGHECGSFTFGPYRGCMHNSI